MQPRRPGPSISAGGAIDCASPRSIEMKTLGGCRWKAVSETSNSSHTVLESKALCARHFPTSFESCGHRRDSNSQSRPRADKLIAKSVPFEALRSRRSKPKNVAAEAGSDAVTRRSRTRLRRSMRLVVDCDATSSTRSSSAARYCACAMMGGSRGPLALDF